MKYRIYPRIHNFTNFIMYTCNFRTKIAVPRSSFKKEENKTQNEIYRTEKMLLECICTFVQSGTGD